MSNIKWFFRNKFRGITSENDLNDVDAGDWE